jgi:hypothetical protein
MSYELAEKFVVLRVGSNPKPHKAVGSFDGERPVMVTHSGGPIAANFLQVKRWVTRIAFE